MGSIKITDYAKRLGIEIPSATAKAVDIEAGKAGYEKYLADVEAYTAARDKQIAEEKEKESWWDKTSKLILQANQMSNQMTNDPVSTAFNQSVAAYKAMPEDNKPTDDWTDEERWAFGEKYATSADEAYAFAKDLNTRKAQENKQKQQEALSRWSSKNVGTGVLASVASLGINTLYGGVGYLDALAQRAAGREIEQNIILPHEISGAMQGGVASALNEWSGTTNDKIPVLGGKGAGDIYNLGMSIAQSRLSAKIAKLGGNQAGTLMSYFGMAASQGVSDAIARGANSNQALAFGTISGLAEAIPEMISVDKIVGMQSAEGVQNIFKNMLNQAKDEAQEEVITSLINEVADRWIMGGKSNYQLRVNELVASGMSPDKAKNRAFAETIEGFAEDALAGFISGGVSGGISTGINRINQQFLAKEQNEAAKKALSPEQNKLIEEAKQYDRTKKRASALEKKIADGKELSGYDLRMLASEVSEATRDKDVDTVRQAIIEQMKKEGLNDSQAKRLGEIALNKAIGNEVSKVQDLMLKRNDAATKVYNQISAEVMESGMGESGWAEKTPIQRLRAEKKAIEQQAKQQTAQTKSAKVTKSSLEQLKEDVARTYGVDTREYKINVESLEGKIEVIDGGYAYKKSGENSRIHTEGISSALTHEDVAELAAIEKIANELGIDVHVYETKVDKNGQRTYTDKSGKRYTDSGFYDPNDNSIHIDLRAGERGEGTMLYTASHEVVHFIKENSPEHYAALEELVLKELTKGGMSIEKLIEEQRKKAIANKQNLTDEQLREEVVAEACQSFLASKSAVAEIKALKTKNKGLWTALKKFFTSLFTKLNKVYKSVDPDSIEGKYIADMRKAVKPIRDAFMEGAVEAAKKNAAIGSKSEAKTTENKAMRSQARIAEAKYNKATANTEILNLVSNVSNGSFEQQDKVYFGTVTTDVAEEIKSITGIDVTGYRMAVEARQISHILKDHGKTGITDHSMADNNDIAKMEYAMRNPDEISYGGKTRAYSTMRNGKNRTADTVLYEKVIGEKSYYVVQATPDTKAKTLYVVTAFIGKSGYKNKMEAPQLANVKNLGVTSEIGSVVTSNDSISQTTEKINTQNENSSKNIRSKSRSYTAGQSAALKANLSHQKVYTKSTAMKFVKAVAPGIKTKAFDELSNDLWIGLNTYTAIDDKQAFAKDMADMIIDRMLVDTEVKNRNWDEAVEKIAYLKPAINTIKFRDEDLPDLEHMLDKNGLRSLRARWGYKSKDGENKRAYGLDEFITDLSREMPGMAYLADMHPTEAMVEVDKLYEKLKETIKQKYESAYADATEEQIALWKSTVESKILDVYEYYGGMSKMLQATSSTSEAVDTYLSTVPEGTEKPEKYFVDILKQMDERISFWKAEKSKTEKISRWNGIIANKALEIRDFKNGAFLNATQYHPDVFKNSIEQLTKVQWRGNISPKGVRKTFAELKQWYSMDNPMLYDKNDKENDNDLYSDVIAFYIDVLSADADVDKPLTAEEYPMIYEVMNHLYTIMKNYGKIFRAGRWVDAAEIAKAYIGIIDENDKKRTPWTRAQSLYNRQFLEPMALAKQADNYNPNGFFTQTMQELRQASIDASVGEMNLRKEYDKFVNANQKYLMKAAKETVKYRGYDIPRLHLISLYMSMKRKQSREGLALNGFEYSMKTKWWDSEDVIKVPGYVPEGEEHNYELINRATEEQMRIIERSFTDTDRQYIAVLERLFNEKLREMKIERDMERQGYTNALEGYYYPIIRGGIAKNVDTAKFTDINRATKSSFNESTQEHAKQYLKIISADAMINRHIKDMCKYYYMSQAIENYNVLYHIDSDKDNPNRNNPRSISERLKTSKVWEKDFDYFKKLVADIQGIRDNKYDSDAWRFIETLRGNYAKFALGLNAKVLFTQVSSVIAAGNVIGFGSIMSINKNVGFVATKEDIENYCPIAAVRSYEQTVLKAMTLSDKMGKISEKMMMGISAMDDLVIRRLFAACQIEAKKRGEGEVGSEENKIAAGKILEQIIIETQQNSYATEKSSAMRSANPVWRGLTMFTADGMKIISRIHEAAGEFKQAKNNGDTVAMKKARKKLARSIAVAASISVYLAAISALFNWIYDRDEEDKDDPIGKKLLRFSGDVLGNFIGALPFISDLYDVMVNGFEVEDVVLDTFNNVYGAINSLYKDATDFMDGKDDRSIEDLNRDLRSMLYAIGQLTGMPMRNVYNLTRGIIGNISPKAAYYIDSKFNETSLVNDLKKSIKEGNENKTSYIMSLIYDERLDERVSKAQSREILRLYEKINKKEIEGYTVIPKDIPDKIKRDGVEIELSDAQKQKIAGEYSKVISAIDKLISSSFYQSLSNKDKAYMIDYYHDKYYETAVNNALKIKDDKVVIYNAVGFSTYAEFAFVTRGIESDKDKYGNTITGSKKAKVIEALDKASKDENKKLLYLASLGYSLTDSQKKKLCKYLNSMSLTASKKKSIAQTCNLTYKNGKIYP